MVRLGLCLRRTQADSGVFSNNLQSFKTLVKRMFQEYLRTGEKPPCSESDLGALRRGTRSDLGRLLQVVGPFHVNPVIVLGRPLTNGTYTWKFSLNCALGPTALEPRTRSLQLWYQINDRSARFDLKALVAPAEIGSTSSSACTSMFTLPPTSSWLHGMAWPRLRKTRQPPQKKTTRSTVILVHRSTGFHGTCFGSHSSTI